jgi:antitoxin MazE
MQVSVIQIGNSKGIRLSKTLLDKYQINDKVELVLESDCIILKPIAEPRKNWEKAFIEMHQNGDDHLLIDSAFADENWD